MPDPNPVRAADPPGGRSPAPALEASITPASGGSVTPTAGTVEGTTVSYPDVYAFAHYIAAIATAAGWTTRNRGGRRYTGSMHGLEDGARRRKD